MWHHYPVLSISVRMVSSTIFILIIRDEAGECIRVASDQGSAKCRVIIVVLLPSILTVVVILIIDTIIFVCNVSR